MNSQRDIPLPGKEGVDACFTLFSALLLLLGVDTIRKVVELATDWSNGHASQILVVPFVSGWLIWLKRKTLFENPRPSVLPGGVVVALGVSLFVFAKTTDVGLSANDVLSLLTGSLIVLWLGGFLMAYGPAAFRAALFPLLFLFSAVPIPSALLDRLIALLQAGSAEMAYRLIKLFGVPVYREGFVFAMPDVVIEVAPACSGIRSAIAIFISGLIAGHVFLRSLWRKAFLLTVAIPVLFFKNAVRIAVLSVLAVHWDKRVLTSSLHTDGGVVFFLLGLCLLYPVLVVLVKSEKKLSETQELDARTSPPVSGGR